MTGTSTAPVTQYAGIALANIASRTRIRLNRRGVQVPDPAEHAQRLVDLFAAISTEPYCASVEHSERILAEFEDRDRRLRDLLGGAA